MDLIPEPELITIELSILNKEHDPQGLQERTWMVQVGVLVLLLIVLCDFGLEKG